MDEYYEMLECFWKWAKMDPDNADVWYGIGIAFLKLGLYGHATRAFRKALVIDPNNKYVWNDLGAVCNEIGCHTEAFEAYGEAIKIDPDMVEAQSGLALTRDLSVNPTPAAETVPDMRHIDPALAYMLNDLMARMG